LNPKPQKVNQSIKRLGL